MSDLIERLRTEQCRLNEGCNALDICACTKMDEAADALEAAEQHIAELEAEIKEWESGALVRGWKETRKAGDE